MSKQKEKPPWFAEWFNSELYTKVYQHRSDSEAHKTVTLMLDVLDLRPGARVLDLACGNGRHTLALHEAGLDVSGLDLSPTLLAQARQRLPQSVRLYEQDMRAPLPGAPYDAIGNFFTSFGYFDDREQDILVLQRVYAALIERNGYFFFDYLNSDFVRDTLVAHEHKDLGEMQVTQERSIDATHVIKKITIERGGEQHSFQERVRLYTYDDFRDMFAAAGLSILRSYGDYSGKPTSKTLPRLILLAQAQ